SPVVEITLKLVDAEGKPAALAGKPETGGTIQWTGVPKAFSKDPFMLTMEADKAKVENVKTTPCGAAARCCLHVFHFGLVGFHGQHERIFAEGLRHAGPLNSSAGLGLPCQSGGFAFGIHQLQRDFDHRT